MCVIRRSANAFSSPGRQVEERDDDERRGKHRQRDVGGRRRTRVAARLEVAAKPEQREPGEARVGPPAQPIPHARQPALATCREPPVQLVKASSGQTSSGPSVGRSIVHRLDLSDLPVALRFTFGLPWTEHHGRGERVAGNSHLLSSVAARRTPPARFGLGKASEAQGWAAPLPNPSYRWDERPCSGGKSSPALA